MPAQLTIRMDPELVDRVQAAARRAGRSTNEHVTIILDAATNPDLAGSEGEQLRERLRRAGLLAEVTPRSGPPPDAGAGGSGEGCGRARHPVVRHRLPAAVTVFADSSAVVKRYADEAHHEIVRAIDDPVTVSALARVEVPSAFVRKQRMGELSEENAAGLLSAFELDWFGDTTRGPYFLALGITDSLLDDAARQVARHGLRASDGVQLATALAVRTVDPTTTFAAFDIELRSAAGREGFTLIPSSLDRR